uniref:DUF7869 domain-containing protein n=1 Tax=Trichogramma kaykai TaxID=54128 RepID=A0ABD2X5R0_9HYME
MTSDLDSDTDPEIILGTNKTTYHLPEKGSDNLVIVCGKMFLDTLGINIQTVRTALAKKMSSHGTFVAARDLRGTHTNRPHQYPVEITNLIISHIKSFPTVESHYVRADTQKNYLPAGLSISRMNRMLNDELSQVGMKEINISRQYYAKVLQENFNLSFHKPKKDKCALCHQYKESTPEQKELLKDRRIEHLKNKKIARKLINQSVIEANSDSSIAVIHFDFQKVSTTSKCEVSNLYYMSKLVVLNLTFYDLATNLDTCYVWNETVAKKGSNEVASILMRQIEYILSSRPKVNDIRTVSDNCTGQNKNQNVFTMLIMMAVFHDVKITHRFLEVGHTQSAGDSMHSTIESYTRHREIFTQDQWAKSMRKACHSKRYVVHQIDQNWIKDFGEMAKMFNWANLHTNDVRELVIDSSNSKLNISVKYDFREKKYQKLKILKKDIEYFEIIKNYNFPQACENKIDITDLKKKHFQTMMQNLWIPEKYHDFYKKIIQ